MRRKSFADMPCSVARSLDVVGDPWTLLVVRDLMFGFSRFDDLQRRLEIPRNTLTQRLGLLVDEGIVDKRPYQDHPPRYDYRLTDKGWGLRSVIISLVQWGDRWTDIGEPPAVFRDRDTGDLVEPLLVDGRTGRPIDEMRVRPERNPAVPDSQAPEPLDSRQSGA